jgi:glycosyltransferase involved in cell wall biosynthesis
VKSVVEILFVENAPGFGGSLTGILHLVDALPGWIHPTLVCGFDPRPFTDIPQRLRVEVVPIDMSKTNREANDSFVGALYRFARYNTWPWARQVERIARKYGASIIHANNILTGNFGAAVAGWRLGIPVIAHQKGYEHPGKLTHWIIDRRWYAHHVATSHSIADHLLDLRVPAERITMIYDAIVPPNPEPARCANEIPVIGMHSVLRESKGQDIFLRAVARVAQRGVGPFRVSIAGGPPRPSPYPDQLRDLAKELGIADRVEFTGHLRDPFTFLAGVDLSVHASIEPEPFGRVAAESMLMGVPVIAAAGSGAAEYVEQANAGYSTPPRDVDALADAIASLVADAPRRQELGQRGRDYALSAFAPATIAEQLVSLYEDLVTGKRHPVTVADRAADCRSAVAP